MLHMSSMTNGYVRRDMNRESNFFSNAEGQEHLLMAKLDHLRVSQLLSNGFGGLKGMPSLL